MMVSVTVISILLTLTPPSHERVAQQRSLTNVTEQVAAFLIVVQSVAQKRNLPVSLSCHHSGNDSWCIGSVVAENGCDCTETDTSADQFCSIDGIPRICTSSEHHCRITPPGRMTSTGVRFWKLKQANRRSGI
jgi:Tfp pilus assembly protein FimT